MKKLLFLIAVVCISMLTACSDDDKSEDFVDPLKEDKAWLDKNIVGRWEMTRGYSYLTGNWFTPNLGMEKCYYDFKADGTVTMINDPFSYKESKYKIFIEDPLLYINIVNEKHSVEIDKTGRKMGISLYGDFKKID